jgi:LysR family transcriptional regulator, glycine cleavage system transcriptional activator
MPQAGMLTVSAPPAFAASWLVPRLGLFSTRHPDIELSIVTTRRLANFSADGVDIAIRHGLGRYPGLRCDRIAMIAMIPVCGPNFLASASHREPKVPADLLGLRLLQDAERQDWALWFQAQGVEDVTQTALSGISFDDQILLMRAAASNQGIALVTETLARPELERGNLVRVLDVDWPQEFAYWLVGPRATADQPKVVAFRDWLLDEGRRISATEHPARRAAPGQTI